MFAPPCAMIYYRERSIWIGDILMKNSSRFLAAAVALACLPGTAWAATYHADSDTGVEALDYIENNRRAARANALTDEQRQLIKDAREMEAHLRHPLKTGDPVPVAFEGDDLSYDERTGEFTVKGHVNILQMDAHRFEADYVQGNTQKRQHYTQTMLSIFKMYGLIQLSMNRKSNLNA